MVQRTSLRVAVCGLLVVSLVAMIAPAGAAPPPRPLCDACGESFEETVEDRGVAVGDEFVTYPIDVRRSTAEVRVRENGTATWVVRNHLDDSAGTDELRTNASYRDAIAESAMWDAEFVAANVSESDVLELRYREQNFAERSVRETLLSGEFTRAYGYRNLDGLGADRLDVIAPTGYRLGWTVSGAEVSADGGRMTITELEDNGFVTFVPRDATFGALWSLLAVGSLVVPNAASNALVIVLPSAVLFGALMGVVPGALRRSGRLVAGVDGTLSRVGLGVDRIVGAPGVSLAVVGAATALGVLAIAAVRVVGPSLLPVLGVGIGYAVLGVAFSMRDVRARASYRSSVAAAALGAAVAAASTLAIAALASAPTFWLASGLPFLIPVFSLLPAGYALGREKRRLAAGTAAVGFAVAAVTVAPIAAPRLGLGLVFVSFVVGANVVSVGIVGAPLLAVGAVLASERDARDSDDSSSGSHSPRS